MLDCSLVRGRCASKGSGARFCGSGAGEAGGKLPSEEATEGDEGAIDAEDPELDRAAGESAWELMPANDRTGVACASALGCEETPQRAGDRAGEFNAAPAGFGTVLPSTVCMWSVPAWADGIVAMAGESAWNSAPVVAERPESTSELAPRFGCSGSCCRAPD